MTSQILEGADSHLFGTIVCLAGHHTAGINQLELVDGQQRLTTISIFLHCLLDRLKAENEGRRRQDCRALLSAKALGGVAKPKILLDSLDAKQFTRHAAGDLDGTCGQPSVVAGVRPAENTACAELSLEQSTLSCTA